MPKKQPSLNEILSEVDLDHLRDIVCNIATSNPEIEEQIRIMLTPKKFVNNTVSYYKKLFSAVPSSITNKATAKLTIDNVTKTLQIAKDLEKSKNYFEANKVYQASFDLLVPKMSKTTQKYFLDGVKSLMISWAKNLNELAQIDHRQTTLEYFFELKNSKIFGESTEVIEVVKVPNSSVSIGQRVTKFVPSEAYYTFVEVVCQNVKNSAILNQIQDFISSQDKDFQSKTVHCLCYIAQNLDDEKALISIYNKDKDNIKVVETMRDYYIQLGHYKAGIQYIYNYLESKKNLFLFKDDYQIVVAQDFVELCAKYPQIDTNALVQQVLVWLTTVGQDQWVYDVGPNAKWWNYYKTLQTDYPEEWNTNYQKILEILKKKRLQRQLVAICLYEKDITLAKTFMESKDIDLGFEIANVLVDVEPTWCLEVIKRYVRYRSVFEYSGRLEEIKTIFKKLETSLPQDSLVDLNKIKTKLKKDISDYGYMFIGKVDTNF
jgi:tetratricopeptide (TPR) repeat protein